MALHDLICEVCNCSELEVNVHHSDIAGGMAKSKCPNCGSMVRSITYALWTEGDVNLFNDGLGGLLGYQRADRKGRVREFGVDDCTLSKIQLGIYSKPTDKGLRNFTDDQTANFRHKLATEGDSGRLRKEVMEVYQSNKDKGL